MKKRKKYPKQRRQAPLLTNANVDSAVRQRMAALISGGYDFSDTLHNVYADYGYPAQISFSQFWNMYRRFGIAKNVVDTYPELGWMESPIIESAPKVLTDLEALNKNMGLWTRLKGLDTRQRVGRYAGLFMRVRDNKRPSEPIEGTLSGLASLVDMIPLYESQLAVTETQKNIMADDYGQPTMYQFKGGESGDRNPDTNDTFDIHPSRIIIASEESDNGSIYGVSCLEAVYNSLMDMRKIIGAGGEGFYKNAAQSIVFDLKDASSASANTELLNEFNENYDEFAANRSRRAIWTPGMDAKTLESNLANPKEFLMNALYDVASGSKIPATVLIGQQNAKVAGDQDAIALLSRVQSRREHFQTGMVSETLDWLMQYGILPAAGYEIEWPDALAASDEQKLGNADKMADINQKQFLSGGGPIFEAEEMREAAGFEVDDFEEDLPSEDIDDELE